MTRLRTLAPRLLAVLAGGAVVLQVIVIAVVWVALTMPRW